MEKKLFLRCEDIWNVCVFQHRVCAIKTEQSGSLNLFLCSDWAPQYLLSYYSCFVILLVDNHAYIYTF